MTDEKNTTWSADHLRVSLFANVVWAATADQVFLGAFGLPPETVTNKIASHESSAVGIWEGLQLEVKRTFNRLDFIVQVVPSETLGPAPFIEDIKSLLPKFSAVIAKWAVNAPSGVIRLALGCNAFFPTSSNADNYAKLKELVKVIVIDVSKFKEFKFQVNLPITSKSCPGLIVNRLSNWSSLSMRGGFIGGAEAPRFFEDAYYVSCSLDVNTDAGRSEPIDHSSVEKLTDELAQICEQILYEGIA